MYTFVFPLLMGGAAMQGQEAGPGAIVSSFLPFVAVILIFYFLIIRPQNKKRKETERMLGALKKGDKIITIGGIHGTIQRVKETTVIVKVDDNVKLEFLRSAISSITTQAEEEKIEDKSSDSDKESSESGE